MSSPHVLELEGGVGQEAVVSSDWSWCVVGWSSVYHVRVVSVVGQEGGGELVVGESSVTVCVVSLYEEINFFAGWEHTNCIQSTSQLVGVDVTVSWLVEDVEGVSNVEVVSLSEGDLGVLEV